MFRSAVFAAALLIAGPVPAETLAPDLSGPQDPVVRGRVEGVPGVRVKTLSATDAAAAVEVSFGIEPFTPASAELGFDPSAEASGPPPGRFYFDGSAATAAARVLVDVSRGATAAAAPAAGEAPPPDLAALCRVDPHAREALAEPLAASF
jgi:hypothetical protein